MAQVIDLKVTLSAEGATASARAFGASLDHLGGKARGLEPAFDRALKGALKLAAPLAALFSAREVFRFGQASVQAFAESEAAVASMGAALAATGDGGEAALRRITEEASRLQAVTEAEDDALIKATASLKTLAPALNPDELAEAQTALIAIAQITGGDLDSAARMLGKTLGSSTNALARYGIEIDKDATASERLAEMLGDQKLGAAFDIATAKAEALGGRTTQMKNAFGDLQEEIGGAITGQGALADAVGWVTEKIREATGWLDSHEAAIQAVTAMMGQWAKVGVAALKALIAPFQAVLRILFNVGQQVGEVANLFGAILARDFRAAGEAAKRMAGNWADMGDALADSDAAWDAMLAEVGRALTTTPELATHTVTLTESYLAQADALELTAEELKKARAEAERFAKVQASILSTSITPSGLDLEMAARRARRHERMGQGPGIQPFDLEPLTKPLDESTSRLVHELETTFQGFLRGFKGGIGDLWKAVKASIQPGNLGQGLSNILAGGITQLASAALGKVVGFVGGLFGESAEEKERKRLLELNAAALENVTKNLDTFASRLADLGGGVAGFRAMLERMQAIGPGGGGFLGGMRDFAARASSADLGPSRSRSFEQFFGFDFGDIISKGELDQLTEAFTKAFERAREQIQESLGGDFGLRELALAGGDVERAKREAAAAKERKELEDLALAGFITAEQLSKFTGIIDEELRRALEDAASAAAKAAEALRSDFLASLEEREALLAGDEAGALKARMRRQTDKELAAAQELLDAGTITEDMFVRLAAVLSGELDAALAQIAERAEQVARDLADDIRLRRAELGGNDADIIRTRHEIQAQKELAAAQALLDAGTITEELFHALATLLDDELAAALAKATGAVEDMVAAGADFYAQWAENQKLLKEDLDLRKLEALGMTDEAARLRLQLQHAKELQEAYMGSGISSQWWELLKEVQRLEREALEKQLAQATGTMEPTDTRTTEVVRSVTSISETTAFRIADLTYALLTDSRRQTGLQGEMVGLLRLIASRSGAGSWNVEGGLATDSELRFGGEATVEK